MKREEERRRRKKKEEEEERRRRKKKKKEEEEERRRRRKNKKKWLTAKDTMWHDWKTHGGSTVCQSSFIEILGKKNRNGIQRLCLEYLTTGKNRSEKRKNFRSMKMY